MITTTDIANIMYKASRVFGLKVYQGGNVPSECATEERVVIHVKELSPGTYWSRAYVEVNFVVPDTPDGKAQLIRLGEIERTANRVLRGSARYDGTTYRYAPSSTQILEEGEELKAHYVNVRVLFEVLNTMEI